jgi:antirestriction protein ArdC
VKANRPKPISTDSKKNAMNTNHQNQINDRLQNQPDQFSTGSDTASNHSSVYDRITERMIALLSQGTIPWRKPWNVQRGFPRNLISKKPYRGVNVLMLHAMQYESPFWLTFHQAQQLGGNVRKGEKSCPVIFGQRKETEDEITGEKTHYTVLRLYNVFNVSQCESLKNIPASTETVTTTAPAAIVANMPHPPEIKHGMASAYYSRVEDTVGIPYPERFTSEDEYFSALYHELTHATGHENRLNRPTITEPNRFSSEEYSREELIAEMGSAFLCGQAGIAELTLNNPAAYLQNWLEALKNDHKLIVQAAAQAQKAADFILGTKFEDAPVES